MYVCFASAVYIPELWPTHLRLRGSGFVNAVGRIVAVFTPYGVAALLTHYGSITVFMVLGVMLVLCALVLSIFDNLSQKVSLEIYRIVQEAVGNSLKHAQATLVKIILVREDNKVKLTVSDNGRGFEQQTGKTGIGLTIIKERVENLRGTLTLNSAPGKGTELIVEIDLENLEK